MKGETCVYLLLQVATITLASGNFELRILEMENNLPDRCPSSRCRTYFRLCLKGYTSPTSPTTSTAATTSSAEMVGIPSAADCSYGNATSPVLGVNSFTVADRDNSEDAKMLVKFKFSWTKAFTLLLEAMDELTGTVLERARYSGIILPSEEWHTLVQAGSAGRLTYRMRVTCDHHYYNTTCSQFCRPRDDQFGHYSCDAGGKKRCIPGWKGDNCDIAICKTGCHPEHGKCDIPGECECRPGWLGGDLLCGECQPYPGCKYGYCNKPYECICHTNWGGILCDRDLNYCGTHEPCVNGGTCSNAAPDQYFCSCPDGFAGDKCEIALNPCLALPCANGGTCLPNSNTTGHFTCNCVEGYTGATCHKVISEIEDECADRCVNALSCGRDGQCECMHGWTGSHCDVNIDDCATNKCHNGATCVDLVNDYQCICAAGYKGKNCKEDINECEKNLCQNGGECVDQINAFQCICPLGYTGNLCQTQRDHCGPVNPCQNGAQCLNTPDDYYCHCGRHWRGRNCSSPRMIPQQAGEGCLVNEMGGYALHNNSVWVYGRAAAAGRTVDLCGDHGKCVNTDGVYGCVCQPGFVGKYCNQNVDECASNPCKNGGTCVDSANAYKCICQDGWEGEACEIDKNDCDPNPCANNGTCVDKLGDYMCACQDGWKGRMCVLRDSHCDHDTCRNGGTCIDLGHSFQCQCPAQWHGATCNMATFESCVSSPCLNGGTCVNSGGDFSCICKQGYEGGQCEKKTEEDEGCRCLNGGRCVEDGWLCECASGYAGPRCDYNIDECSSSPCAYGATCVDGVGYFQCICPPGRTGNTCQLDERGKEISVSNACKMEGSGGMWSRNETWKRDCNACWCETGGRIRCTDVWCGLPNCLQYSSSTPCKTNQVCVPSSSEVTCLSGNCEGWGQCWQLTEGRQITPPTLPTIPPFCSPLSEGCVRLSLAMETSRIRRATTSEHLCREVRSVIASYCATKRDATTIYVLCQMKHSYNDTVEITMWSATGIEDVLSDSARYLSDVVARKKIWSSEFAPPSDNLSLLSAVVEVKLETVSQRPISKPISETFTGMLIVCAIAVVTSLTCVSLTLYIVARRNIIAQTKLANHDEEKSNNEENHRRYPIAVIAVDKGGGVGNTSSDNFNQSAAESLEMCCCDVDLCTCQRKSAYLGAGLPNINKRNNCLQLSVNDLSNCGEKVVNVTALQPHVAPWHKPIGSAPPLPRQPHRTTNQDEETDASAQASS